LILDYSEDNFSTLFYPKTLGLNLNRNIYHFYVPLYLAMQLRSEGFSQRAAYLAPLMMTLSYEFLTTASDARYVLKDPPQLDAFEGMGKLKDIFGGHTGAVFGVGRNNEVDFNTFTESFSRSTREAVNLLINHSN